MMDLGDEYDAYVKNHLKYNEETCNKKDFREIAKDFINNKIGKITNKDKKYWLVFTKDTGQREDCNVYYTNLVRCRTKKEAILITAIDTENNMDELDELDAIPLKLKTINTLNKYFLKNLLERN
jgi:hypothetical protein